jgi:ribosomal protein S18 acetylase RimI-like enzyme
MLTNINIKELSINDLDIVKQFSDKWIGSNYYSPEDLKQVIDLSDNTSFCAWDNSKLIGIRLTYSIGEWIQTFSHGLTINKWKVNQTKVAYFKSLFIHPSYQNQKIGKRLSTASIQALKKKGAEAIICHSWLESPNNSSLTYLNSFGFTEINRHKNFWSDNNYECIRCGTDICKCTAVEMIKLLS